MNLLDASTREFLAFLARNRGSSRLLALATYRSDDVSRDHPLHRYLMELQRDPVELLTLPRFDRAELRQQVEAIREEAGNERLLCLFNCSGDSARWSIPAGAGAVSPAGFPGAEAFVGGGQISLPPLGVLVARLE